MDYDSQAELSHLDHVYKLIEWSFQHKELKEASH